METRLAERMMYTVIRRGGVINASDVEGVRSVLADAAENFSKTPGFVSEKKVAAEVARRLQKECSWDVRSEPVRKTVAEFTDQFTQIVAKNRADFYLYYRNQDAARAAAADFDNVMSDETYFRLERNSRLNQHLGIRNADFEIPEHYDLKKFLPRLTMSAVLQRISRFLSRGRRKSTGTIMKMPKTSAGRWPKTSKR